MNQLQIEQRLTWIIIAAYAVFALAFSLGPIFEGPDEIAHYRYVRYLRDFAAFPNAYDPTPDPTSTYYHAPLYYLLNVPLLALFDDADFDQVQANPFYGHEIGISSDDNRNQYLHPQREAFPYNNSGTAAAVHALRLLSVALGICTLSTAAAVFRRVFAAAHLRLMALAVMAFHPQFVYISSVINNDNLLYLLFTLTLWLLFCTVQDGLLWRRSAALGVVLGAALLTKTNGLFLGLPVALTFALALWHGAPTMAWHARLWLLARHAALILTVMVLIAGWWYVRNTQLYGDPLNARLLYSGVGGGVPIRPDGLALDIGITRLGYAYDTFWARLGSGTVLVAEWMYHVYSALTILATLGVLIGVGLWWRNGRDARAGQAWALIVAFAVVGFGLLLYIASTIWTGNNGRYVLPSIAAWAALLAGGMDVYVRRWPSARLGLASGIGGGMCALLAYVLFGFFYPAYDVNPAPNAAAPALYHYADANGPIAELIGIDPPLVRAQAGAVVRVTVLWRALRPSTSPLLTYLHTQNSALVRRDSHPATGNLLSTDWHSGQTWAETYIIRIPTDASPQTSWPLIVGLNDADGSIITTHNDGQQASPIVGLLAINAPPSPALPTVDYVFGEYIMLHIDSITATANADEYTLCLIWQTTASISAEYQLYVHVLDVMGAQVGSYDRAPRDGYPTRGWGIGETIEQCVTMPILRDQTLQIGLYDLNTLARLPVATRAASIGALSATGDGVVFTIPQSSDQP
jgi:4-amino-4-deoxy-L-arabinose transferase-like glycosyltransferase